MSHLKQNLGNLINTTFTNFAAPTLAEISEVNHENYTCKCTGISKTGEKTDVVYPKVPIPKFWASSTGGIFMAPSPKSIVLLNFLDNDTNYPIIVSIMGSDHSEKSKEDTLIITCGNTKLILDDRIFLSAGGKNIGKLLTDMADNISKLKTTITTPLTSIVTVAVSTGTGTGTISNGSIELDKGQQPFWNTMRDTNIPAIFHIDEPS